VELRRAELLAGVVLAVLGALSLVEALRLRDDWQGARLMPGALGVVLVALALGHLTMRASVAGPAWPEPAAGRRVAALMLMLIGYVVVLPVVGFLVSTALFVLVVLRALRAGGWLRCLVLTVVIAAGCELVFRQWLGMPLP
jgi:hypothetical protein